MTYRVVCNLDIAFQSRAEAIKQTVEKAQGLDVKIETNRVHLEVHKCYHGDLEPRPCEMIEVMESLPIKEA